MHYFLPFPKVDQRKRIGDSTLDNSWAMQPQQGNNTCVFIQKESRKRKSAKVTFCIFKSDVFYYIQIIKKEESPSVTRHRTLLVFPLSKLQIVYKNNFV